MIGVILVLFFIGLVLAAVVLLPNPTVQVKDLPEDQQEKYRKRHNWLKGHIDC